MASEGHKAEHKAKQLRVYIRTFGWANEALLQHDFTTLKGAV